MTDLSWLAVQPPPDSAPRPATGSSWRWATVVGTGPLQIRLDGETVPLPDPPETLVGGLSVGRRVWVQLHGRMAVVVGAASDDTGRINDFSPTSGSPFIILPGSFWRVTDGWAEMRLSMQATAATSIGAQRRLVESGRRPDSDQLGTWRYTGNGEGGLSVSGSNGAIYLWAASTVSIPSGGVVDLQLTPMMIN